MGVFDNIKMELISSYFYIIIVKFHIWNSILVEYLSEYILDHRHNWIRPGRRKLHLLMELKDYIVLKDYEHDYILQSYQYIYKFVIPRPKPQILVLFTSIQILIIYTILFVFAIRTIWIAIALPRHLQNISVVTYELIVAWKYFKMTSCVYMSIWQALLRI